MHKFFTIFCMYMISLSFSCIFPESRKTSNKDTFNTSLDKYFALKAESDKLKDTTNFIQIEISDDSLDIKLYELLDAQGDMSETMLLKNIENLIQRGANPNAMVEVTYSVRKLGTYLPIIRNFYQDKYNEYTTVNTPMHAAVSNGNVPVLEKIIALGGNINLMNKDKIYPIDVALRADNIKILECLLANGCKASNANLSMSENTALIERMVKLGASPKTININYALDDKDQLKRLLLLKPAINDIKIDMDLLMADDELFDLLLANGMSTKVSGKFPDECPILFSAIKYGNMRAFLKLHQKGASLQTKCNHGFGETPLQIAIYYQRIEIIDYLLKNKVSPNEKDWTGKSALILACNTDNDQIINMLIEKGAELEYAGYFGNTPLMYTCQYQYYISAETLIKKKANLNFVSEDGETALILAISANDYAMIKLLIENGANPKIKYNSKNIVEYAQEKDASPAVIQYLKNLLQK